MRTTTDAETDHDQSGRDTSLPENPPCGKGDCLLETGMLPCEYIIELLQQHGGRMAQRDIVTASNWSRATVSRRLSSMEDEGSLGRLRLGRRKIVYLPEAQPEMLGATLDGQSRERVRESHAGEHDSR